MQYAGFVATVEREAGIPREEAERAVRATLTTLAERISRGEAEDLAEQLPPEVRGLLADGRDAESFGADEFLRRVAEREGTIVPTAERHARAVFAALGRAVSDDEITDMASELPRDYRRLVAAARSQPDQHGPRPPAVISYDLFLELVAQRAELDREGAERATDAVLEVLGDRISAGQVDDLMAQLPYQLHPALERGVARSHGAARPLSVQEFVEEVAELEGVDPDTAYEHTRAVLAALREAVTDKEFYDMTAQLPNDYAELLDRP
jgi:uncharacterized protein (DUF2267 family)